MQIVINIDENHYKYVLAMLKSFKSGIIKDLKITNDAPKSNNKEKILENAKGLLKNRISDPMEYQRKLREEWERA